MKRFLTVFIVGICALTAFSCDNGKENTDSRQDKELITVIEKDEIYSDDGESAESTCPYAIMHGGVIYYDTGEYAFETVEYNEDDVLGKVTSVIPETKMPEKDGQANIPIEGSLYIKHELAGDGILVLIDDRWVIFEARNKVTDYKDNMQSSEDNKEKSGEKEAVPNVKEKAEMVKFEQPPALTLTAYDNTSIKAMCGSCNWTYFDEKGNGVTICADGRHPLQAKENMPVLSVKPSVMSRISMKTVYLNFEAMPHQISVRAWAPEYFGKTYAESVPVNVEIIDVDFNDGSDDSYAQIEIFPEEYIYEVTASWKNKQAGGFEGTATYGFIAKCVLPEVIGGQLEIQCE